MDLANAFSSIDIALESPEQFASTGDGPHGLLSFPRKDTCTALPSVMVGGMRCSHLGKPPLVTMFWYIDGSMLTSDSLAELKAAARSLRQALGSGGEAENDYKVQGPGLPVRFLGVVCSGKTPVLSAAGTDKVRLTPTCRDESGTDRGWSFGSWRVSVPHLALCCGHCISGPGRGRHGTGLQRLRRPFSCQQGTRPSPNLAGRRPDTTIQVNMGVWVGSVPTAWAEKGPHGFWSQLWKG